MVRSIHRLAYHAIMAGSLMAGSLASAAHDGGLQVGDAYAYRSADGQVWTIGNGAMEQVFAGYDGRFRLISYKNKLTDPPSEYVNEAMAGAPFTLDARPFAGRYLFDELWAQDLGAGSSVDFSKSNLSIIVKKGDLVG